MLLLFCWIRNFLIVVIHNLYSYAVEKMQLNDVPSVKLNPALP